jgi:hypothetical protein
LTPRQQAKDLDLQNMAALIRLRAERRAGELLKEMKEKGERQKSGENRRGIDSTAKVPSTPNLSDLGISRNQSSTWQKVAAIPASKFEAAIAR